MKYLFVLIALAAQCAYADSRVTLVEYFTNSGCVKCVTPSQTLDSLIEAIGPANLAVVRYHNGSPAPGDPFYIRFNHEVDSVQTKYQVGTQGDPLLFLDGIITPSNWGPVMHGRLSQAAPVSIALAGTYGNRSGTLEVTISGNTGSLPPGTKLFAIMTETGVYFDQASNGEDNQQQVYRGSISSWAGIDPGTKTHFSLPFTVGRDSTQYSGSDFFVHDWDPDSCNLIVWMQSPGSPKTVFNASQVHVTSLSPAAVGENVAPNSVHPYFVPNPAHAFTALRGVTVPGSRIVLYDMLGRAVRQMVAGSDSPMLDMRGLAAGVYHVSISNSGQTISQQLIHY